MMAELIDRRRLKAEAKQLLSSAQVSPKAVAALYMGVMLAMDMVDVLAGGGQAVVDRNIVGVFAYVVVTLLQPVLGAGFALYCMAIRRGERAEFLTLFDGFTFAGKIVLLELVTGLFVGLWSMLFVIPGIVAMYRYRFAPYALYEDPSIGVMEALQRSKRYTRGYKGQLFLLDWSYVGWVLLATLPQTVESMVLSYQTIMNMGANMGAMFYTTTLPELPTLTGPWTLLWTLLSGLWTLVIGLFYIPNQQCVELAYYDTAKRTSGADGETNSPVQNW